jgi:hypothetical protein
MKTPSGTFIVIVLAVIALALVLIFRAVAQGPNEVVDDKKFFLKIEKGKEDFVEFRKDGKEQFDAVLRKLKHPEQYHIRYKKDLDPHTSADSDYTPPRVGLKTDKVTTSELAKNEPPGDPHVTQKVACDSLADIKEILDALK